MSPLVQTGIIIAVIANLMGLGLGLVKLISISGDVAFMAGQFKQKVEDHSDRIEKLENFKEDLQKQQAQQSKAAFAGRG